MPAAATANVKVFAPFGFRLSEKVSVVSAAAGLRNKRYTGEHALIREELMRLASDFSARNGYRPPYWVLLRLALNSGG